ncbi:BLUF domain-containing protein [Hymenobacter sp. DG01]|uniref:BLUF domain-containing protein n=1 Tax=Hymenobacter sp. DG01 TaxID=2584940 RepID=UPI001124C52A|nr:BLUF domain-containing protein [Hymenobacter sp. DG01]
MDLLHHLIYQSEAVAPLTEAELGRLLEQCYYHNQLTHITGILLFDGSRFLQVLEGPPPAVAAVFGRIRTDCRHTAVQVLADGPVTHRQFAGWAIGLVDEVRTSSTLACRDLPGLHTVTDAALWLLIREFQANTRRARRLVAP